MCLMIRAERRVMRFFWPARPGHRKQHEETSVGVGSRGTQAGKSLLYKNRLRVSNCFSCPHHFIVLREEQRPKRDRTAITDKQLAPEYKRDTSFIFGAFENSSAELKVTGPRGGV